MSAFGNINETTMTQIKSESLSSLFLKQKNNRKPASNIPNETQTPSSAISLLLSTLVLLYSLTTVLLIYILRNSQSVSKFTRVCSLIICALSFTSFTAHMIFHFVLRRTARRDTRQKQLVVIYIGYVLFTLTHVIMSSLTQFLSIELMKLSELETMLLYDYIFLFSDVIFKFLWIVFFGNDFKCIVISNIFTVALVFLYAIANSKSGIPLYNLFHFPLYFLLYAIITIISFKLKTCKENKETIITRTGITECGSWNCDVMDDIASGYMVIINNSSPSNESNVNLNFLPSLGGLFEVKYFNKFFEKENEFFECPSLNRTNCYSSLSILSLVLSDLTQVNSKIFHRDENNPNVKTLSSIAPFQLQSSMSETKDFLNVKSQSNELINLKSKFMTKVNSYVCGANGNNSNINNNIHYLLEGLFNRVESNGKFTYLGKKVITKEDSRKTLVLEIYVRISGSKAEFIFNDMTKYHLYNGIHQLILQNGQYLHDFKNPLICINDEMLELKLHNDFLYEVLLENFPDYQEVNFDKYVTISDKFEYLIRMSEYCRGMIASYEDFSRLIFKPRELKINIEKIDLREMLTFLESMMKFKIKKSKKDVEFKLPNRGEGDIIYTDHIKLQQILMNILSNSLKFTSIGNISLIVSKEVIEGRRYVKFLIQDTGIGMASNVVENLCTPFYSCANGKMNQEGCGLGLLIVKELSEKLGIGLKISSVESKGTEMWFYAENQSPEGEEIKVKRKKTLNSIWKSRTMRQSAILEKESECDESTSQVNLNVDKTPKTPIASMTKAFSLNFMTRYSSTIANNPSVQRIQNTATLPCFKQRNSFNSQLPIQAKGSSGSDNKTLYQSMTMKRPISRESENSKLWHGEISPQLEITFEIKTSMSSKLLNSLLKLPSQTSCNYEKMRGKSASTYKFDRDSERIKDFKNLKDFPGRDIEKSRSNGIAHSLITGRTVTENNVNPANQSYLKSDDNVLDSPQGSCVIHVLIIDDDDGIRANSKRLFLKIEQTEQKILFHIDEADDGFTGLVRIINKSQHIPPEKYDIIILDEEMSYLNGTDLYKILGFLTINKFGSRSNFDMGILSKILICSGDGNSIQSKIQIVPEAIIHKPLNFDFMSNYVRKICPV